MASFFPLISEILPMILPAATHVTRARDLEPRYPTVEGPVTIRPAVVDKCDRMSATVLTVRPQSETPVHHNSEQDAIMYTVSGTACLTVNEGFDSEPRKHDLSAGDFAFIPAWTEHRLVNKGRVDLVSTTLSIALTPPVKHLGVFQTGKDHISYIVYGTLAAAIAARVQRSL